MIKHNLIGVVAHVYKMLAKLLCLSGLG